MPQIAYSQLPPRNEKPTQPDTTVPNIPREPDIEIQPRTKPWKVDNFPGLVVKKFIFLDSTVISEKDLQEIVQPYIGKNISMIQFYEIEDKLNQLYDDKGFFTSGASIFIQDNPIINLKNAEIKIRIIEGKIGTINIFGSSRLSNYIKQRLYKRNKVVNRNELQKNIRLLIDDPLIKKLSIRLFPSGPLNYSNIDVNVEPSTPYHVSLFIDNYRNCNVGCLERGVDFTALNPSTLGDKLSFTYVNSDGSNSIFSSYVVPINSENTTVGFNFSYGNNAITAFPANILNIKSLSQNYSLSIRQPILRLATNKIRLDSGLTFGIERYVIQDSLLGINIPVSRGADNNGLTKLTIINLAHDVTYKDSSQIASLKSEARIGVDVDAATGPGFHEGTFLSFREEGLWIHKLTSNIFLESRVAAQYATSTVPSSEQLSLGGIWSVPGYPQDSALVDYGLFGGVSLFKAISLKKFGQLYIGPSFNFGYGGNNGALDSKPVVIAAPGLNINYELNQNLFANFTYALPLIDIGQRQNTLQGDGLYMSIRYVF